MLSQLHRVHAPPALSVPPAGQAAVRRHCASFRPRSTTHWPRRFNTLVQLARLDSTRSRRGGEHARRAHPTAAQRPQALALRACVSATPALSGPQAARAPVRAAQPSWWQKTSTNEGPHVDTAVFHSLRRWPVRRLRNVHAVPGREHHCDDRVSLVGELCLHSRNSRAKRNPVHWYATYITTTARPLAIATSPMNPAVRFGRSGRDCRSDRQHVRWARTHRASER